MPRSTKAYCRALSLYRGVKVENNQLPWTFKSSKLASLTVEERPQRRHLTEVAGALACLLSLLFKHIAQHDILRVVPVEQAVELRHVKGVFLIAYLHHYNLPCFQHMEVGVLIIDLEIAKGV